jgi:hypothetical protein
MFFLLSTSVVSVSSSPSLTRGSRVLFYLEISTRMVLLWLSLLVILSPLNFVVCDTLMTTDPCKDSACPASSICQVDKDSRTPYCTCDDQVCHTQRMSRNRIPMIRSSAKFEAGKTRDPSLDSTSVTTEEDDDKRDQDSSLDETVCASDGKTYPSECFVENKSCRSGIQLRTISKGNCVQGNCLTHDSC